ncbi:MAG: M48 family metalloprotease [Terriglobales bacterium]
MWRFLRAVAWLVALTGAAISQCRPLPPLPVPPADVLSPAQQARVGQFLVRLNPWPELSAPALLDHVRAVGARLAAQLPPHSGYRFHYHLLDEPYPNAFIMPGGQIFLTRPLLELMRNDSDLAGVLGHEMGHDVTGQLGARLSHLLLAPHPGASRLPAGVNLGRQFNAALTWLEDHPGRLRPPRSGQEAADRVALELTARAGYDPLGLVRVYARLTARQAESGFRLWDLLRLAPPDQRRLDAMAKAATQIPSCRPPVPPDPRAFDRWRAAVVAYQPPPGVSLPGLRRIVHLTPALGAGFRELRFSPDGHFLLVIGAAQAWVVRRAPLGVLLRIPLSGVVSGRFAPDNGSVVLVTEEGRIEKWSLPGGSRQWTVEEDFDACGRAALAPGGRWWACAMRDGRGLRITRIPSHALVLRAKTDFTSLSFSSDGRFLLAGAHRHWALLDLQMHRWSRWPNALFAGFVAPRVVLACGSHQENGSCWSLLGVPSGHRLAWLRLGSGVLRWRKATSGDAYFTWIQKDQAWAVVNGSTGRVLGVSRSGALDGYNGVFAAGAANATVEMVRFGSHGPRDVASLRLPAAARLQPGTVLAASSDLNWLGASHGGKTILWNLSGVTQGIIVPLSSRSIGFSPDAAWLAVIGKGGANPRRVRVGLRKRQLSWLQPPARGTTRGWWSGDTWVAPLPSRMLVVGDSALGRRLWQFRVPRHSSRSLIPTLAIHGGHVILTDCARRQGWLAPLNLKFGFGNPRLFCGAAGQRFTVLRASGGAVLARLTVVRPPWVELSGTQFAGRRLVLADILHRAMAYDAQTGGLIAVRFGYPIAASAAAQAVVLQNGPRRMDIYSLPDFHRVRTLRFPSSTVWAKFSADGRRLLVLTRGQAAYLFAVSTLLHSADRLRPPRPAASLPR